MHVRRPRRGFIEETSGELDERSTDNGSANDNIGATHYDDAASRYDNTSAYHDPSTDDDHSGDAASYKNDDRLTRQSARRS
jgi:hypothetical protein